jgi:hypothetical protein
MNCLSYQVFITCPRTCSYLPWPTLHNLHDLAWTSRELSVNDRTKWNWNRSEFQISFHRLAWCIILVHFGIAFVDGSVDIQTRTRTHARPFRLFSPRYSYIHKLRSEIWHSNATGHGQPRSGYRSLGPKQEPLLLTQDIQNLRNAHLPGCSWTIRLGNKCCEPLWTRPMELGYSGVIWGYQEQMI